MSYWSYIFDSEYRQRSDINEQKEQLGSLEEKINEAASQSQIKELKDRLARAELLFQALFELLQIRADLTREELDLMIQRIDLADGFEDGAIGPDRSADAPQCANCGRPANPKRQECAFCFEALVIKEIPKDHVRMSECKSCNKRVPEKTTYFTADGLVCSECFSKR